MRVARIQRIRNYRVFRDFVWPDTLNDFGQFNLIYGWNGTGKTTLSNLFRLVANRVNPSEGEFEFVIDNRTVRSSAVATAELPPIRVFNRDFVDSSVFETVFAAVRAFNDKVCKEDLATSKLPALQAKFMCMRQASQMTAMKVAADVVSIAHLYLNDVPKLPSIGV